jgi:hypothetical protein
VNEEELRYEILNKCSHGPEEFFIMASLVEDEHAELLARTLAAMVHEGLLEAGMWGMEGEVHPSEADLVSYVRRRLEAGEDLEEIPHVVHEYTFFATDKGRLQLREEDRPVPIEELRDEEQ